MSQKFSPLQLVEHMSPRAALGLCAASALLLLLAGCQSLEQSGAWLGRQADQGWAKTRQTVRTVLRPAPADSALFTHNGLQNFIDTGDAALNAHKLEQMVWIASLQHPSYKSTHQHTYPRQTHNQRQAHRFHTPTRTHRSVHRAPIQHEFVRRAPQHHVQPIMTPREMTSQRTVESAPAPKYAALSQDTSAQPSHDPVSYVKVDGTLSMSDWMACEQRTGGAFIVTRSGTTVASDFDSCMRERGYVPESEADAILAGG